MKRFDWPKIINYILKFLIIIVMVRQIYLKEWFFAFTCFYTLIIFSIPKIIDRKFKIDLPDTLEITIYLFVFAAEILGEINEYYLTVSWWDDLLHAVSGFVLAGVGIFFINLLNKKKNIHFSLSPLYVTIASFCFSMTILVFWEFFEYGADKYFKADMQKDTIVSSINSVKLNEDKRNKPVKKDIGTLVVNGEDWSQKYGGYIDIGLHDTMNDLFDGFLGASVYSVFGYIYLKRKDGKGFAKKFIPKLNSAK